MKKAKKTVKKTNHIPKGMKNLARHGRGVGNTPIKGIRGIKSRIYV